MSKNLSILDVNPLEHLTSDISISQYNYQSIMNGLIEWETSKMDTITIRLATNTEPYFVDYTISTKYAYDTKSGYTVSSPLLAANCFAYKERLSFTSMYDPDADANDAVNIRVSVADDGGNSHKLFIEPAVYDEITTDSDGKFSLHDTYDHSYIKNLYFRLSLPGVIELYRTIETVEQGDEILPWENCVPIVSTYGSPTYNPENVVGYDLFVLYNGALYKSVSPIQTQYKPDNTNSGYVKYVDVYSDTATYSYGSYVYYFGEFFVHTGESDTMGTSPILFDEDNNRIYQTKYWTRALLIDTYNYVAGGVVRYVGETDTVAYVIRNVGTEADSADVSIHMTPSIKVKGTESKQAKGVNVLNSSNFVRYPTASSIIWRDGKVYGPTEEAKGVYDLQIYTATMIFNHADPNVSKMNIISYDGPDLDQGLAIFLPVEVTGEDGGVCEPADGYMFEFLFRIWPNPALNGRTVNDLIVNKAHIYVYNITDYTNFSWKSRTLDQNNVKPLAKFSMARLTNFYVFGENVGVPDKPVVYKARFIYSKDEHSWKTFDYYQFPDHVFMSPGGFVDPMDANGEAYPGVETGGFPLFQDPFASTDLSPVRITDEYIARITDM